MYFFSAVGLALILVGTYFGASLVANKLMFEKYPIPFEESYCGPPGSPYTDQEACHESLESARLRTEKEDMKRAAIFIGLGLAVFFPHWKKLQTGQA